MTKVKLLLTGRQRGEDGEEAVTRTRALAEYTQQSDTLLYILYDETAEDASAVCKNIIKLKSTTLELTKRGAKGAPSTRMVFEPGKIHNVNYVTPYGCLQMEVDTHKVETSFLEGLPQIQAEYTLTSEGRLLSHCLLTIQLRQL